VRDTIAGCDAAGFILVGLVDTLSYPYLGARNGIGYCILEELVSNVPRESITPQCGIVINVDGLGRSGVVDELEVIDVLEFVDLRRRCVRRGARGLVGLGKRRQAFFSAR